MSGQASEDTPMMSNGLRVLVWLALCGYSLYRVTRHGLPPWRRLFEVTLCLCLSLELIFGLRELLH